MNTPWYIFRLSNALTQAATGTITHARGFMYSIQKNAYIDLEFGNDAPG